MGSARPRGGRSPSRTYRRTVTTRPPAGWRRGGRRVTRVGARLSARSARPGRLPTMSIRGQAVIVGAYEHPAGRSPTARSPRSTARWPSAPSPTPGSRSHDVDAYFCDSTAPGFGPVSMAEYLGLAARYVDSHRDRRQLLPRPRRARGGRHRGRQVPGRAHHAGRPAPHRRRPTGRRRSAWPTARRPASSRSGIFAPVGNYALSASAATCTSSARPASSWRGSRWPPRSTPSTTRTRCSATS